MKRLGDCIMKFHLSYVLLSISSILCSHTLLLRADERLKGIACRSVHLWYPLPKGIVFYNEIKVERSAKGTYFMVCGWNKGYFGIQELANGKKLILFSVWDSGQNDPKAVEKEKRVKLLHKDKDVRVGRFGGEGTGGQSFFDYDWKVGHTYQLMVQAKPNGNRTEYSGYFFVPETKKWKHLVTFSTITGGVPLSGYYSFVEDFRRNRVSATQPRIAAFGNTWVRSTKGQWMPATQARFTADRNPVMNINSWIKSKRFHLATGGDTKNEDAKLGGTLKLDNEKRTPPPNLPAQN